jgi:hypothetical protein
MFQLFCHAYLQSKNYCWPAFVLQFLNKACMLNVMNVHIFKTVQSNNSIPHNFLEDGTYFITQPIITTNNHDTINICHHWHIADKQLLKCTPNNSASMYKTNIKPLMIYHHHHHPYRWCCQYMSNHANKNTTGY